MALVKMTKTNQIKATAAFSTWIQVRGGKLPAEAANRIMGGEDFDEVIESCLGDHPTAVESQIPGEYWLCESDDIEEIEQVFENFKEDSLSCIANGVTVPFKALIVPLGDAESVLEEGHEAFVSIRDLPAHIGEPAAKAIATLHHKACELQEGLFKWCKRLNEDESRYIWVFLDNWKGLWLSAENSFLDNHIPNVTFIFFLVSWGLPFGDEVVDQDGEAYELIAGQRQYSLYMPAIVIGDEAPELSIEDDSDQGIQRLVIEERGDPVVVYDSLVTDDDDDDDDDDDGD